MRRFIQYLKAAWLYSQFFPYVEKADEEGFWTDDDAKNTLQFFQSHSGRKLGHRLRNYAIQSALSAVKNPTNSKYNNGVAAGIPMTIVAIENHFPGGVPTDAESEQSEVGGLDQLETTA